LLTRGFSKCLLATLAGGVISHHMAGQACMSGICAAGFLHYCPSASSGHNTRLPQFANRTSTCCRSKRRRLDANSFVCMDIMWSNSDRNVRVASSTLNKNVGPGLAQLVQGLDRTTAESGFVCMDIMWSNSDRNVRVASSTLNNNVGHGLAQLVQGLDRTTAESGFVSP